MLDSLITSKTRIKLLLKFFLNSDTKSYLRNLESEFGESTNAIRLELNRLEDAGLLQSSTDGNKKMFQANTRHPLYEDINSLVRKFVGIDRIIDNVISKIGDLKAAYITGKFAMGIDSRIIDLILVGETLDRPAINQLVSKAEQFINRRIRFIIVGIEELREITTETPVLLIWQKDNAE